MKKNTKQTEEYFLKKFEAQTPRAKCNSIFECFVSYNNAIKSAEKTTSKIKLEKLDDVAEINFRLARKQMSLLNEKELTTYLELVKERMERDFASIKETDMLNARMQYSLLLRHIPEGLTPQQQTIKKELQSKLENFYIRNEIEM